MTLPTTDTIYDTMMKYMTDTIASIKDSLYNRASINLNDPNTVSVFMKDLKATMVMFLFLFISSIIMYYISTDKNAMDTKIYYYLFIVMIPIALGFFAGKEFLFPSEKTSYEPFIKGGIYLLVIFLIIQLFTYLASSASTLALFNSVVYLLLFLIIITGLSLIYFLFSNYLKQQTGYSGIFVRTLFYLPCLFADFVNYLKKEWNMTPHIAVILLILEIFFIAMYLILPMLINKISKMNSNVILSDPVELHIERTIAGSKHFLVNKLEEIDESGRESLENKWKKWYNRFLNKDKLQESQLYKHEPTYRDNNYSISFWAYVNAGGISDQAYMRESNILNYANGKPRITYISNGQHKGNRYNIYYSNVKNVPPFEIVLNDGNQKWNQFVITYHDNSADIFINGKLVRTAVFNKDNLPLPGDESDTITIGQENGLKGAICNVSYYHYALSPREISSSYNIHRFKNPPVFL